MWWCQKYGPADGSSGEHFINSRVFDFNHRLSQWYLLGQLTSSSLVHFSISLLYGSHALPYSCTLSFSLFLMHLNLSGLSVCGACHTQVAQGYAVVEAAKKNLGLGWPSQWCAIDLWIIGWRYIRPCKRQWPNLKWDFGFGTVSSFLKETHLLLLMHPQCIPKFFP